MVLIPANYGILEEERLGAILQILLRVRKLVYVVNFVGGHTSEAWIKRDLHVVVRLVSCLHDEALRVGSIFLSHLQQGRLQALERAGVVSRDELASELRGHAPAEAVCLIQALEQGELRRLQSLLIDDWLDAPLEVLVIILG